MCGSVWAQWGIQNIDVGMQEWRGGWSLLCIGQDDSGFATNAYFRCLCSRNPILCHHGCSCGIFLPLYCAVCMCNIHPRVSCRMHLCLVRRCDYWYVWLLLSGDIHRSNRISQHVGLVQVCFSLWIIGLLVSSLEASWFPWKICIGHLKHFTTFGHTRTTCEHSTINTSSTWPLNPAID